MSSFQEVFAQEVRIGRQVADLEFEKALLSFSRADELHFFCANAATRNRFEQVFGDLIRAGGRRVRAFTFLDLPACLQHYDYTAIHQADPVSYFTPLAHVRNALAPTVPLTAVTHTISYREIISETFKKLLPGPMPFDALVATSRSAAEVVQRNLDFLSRGLARLFGENLAYSGRIERIPLGVDTDRFQPRDRLAARRRLGLPDRAFVILSLARFNYFLKMDLLPLLHFWRRSPVRKGALLILAGAEEIGYSAMLQGQVRDLGLEAGVLVRPNPNETVKADLLAAADVFISPVDNVQETFGLTVIEAAASGLPALVSDFDGYKDLVDPGRTGYLLPTAWAPDHPVGALLSATLLNNIGHLIQSQGTYVSLAELERRLAELRQHPEKRAEMGRQARQAAIRRFDWRVVIGLYETLWGELKASALAYQGPPGPIRDPFAFTWSDIFGHYPSGPLPDDALLTLTRAGRDYLADQARPAMYSDVAPLLATDLLKELTASLAKGPRPLSDLRNLAPGLDRALLDYHIVWLLKNYYLQFLDPETA
ncbi:MAG: glycosyltransferase family 4 protein [Proteobacteria bacterium]|nr:glycosyltransferase family 4 protein [Pseudomonadota bacterium]